MIDKNSVDAYDQPMARIGRPKLPKGMRKHATVTVRMTFGEKRALEDTAKTAELKLATWARSALLNAAGVVA